MSAVTRTEHVDQVMFPRQAAAPAGPVDLIGMYLMHHAFRRDLTAFAAVVAATPVEDRSCWRALEDRWTRFSVILHKHHRGEDTGLWPLLLRRVDAAGDRAGRETLEAMEAEHAEIDPLLESCAAGFAHADADARDALGVRVVAVGERLSRHLAHEETSAMALVQRYLTNADWSRVEHEYFKSAYGPRQMPFVASWGLHGLPAHHLPRVIDSMAGKPLELLWRLFWRRSFERRERKAFRHIWPYV
jgi:hypothetical protein